MADATSYQPFSKQGKWPGGTVRQVQTSGLGCIAFERRQLRATIEFADLDVDVVIDSLQKIEGGIDTFKILGINRVEPAEQVLPEPTEQIGSGRPRRFAETGDEILSGRYRS